MSRTSRYRFTGRPLLNAVTARLIDLEQLLRLVDTDTVPAAVVQYIRAAVHDLDDAVDLYGEQVAAAEQTGDALV